MPKKSSWLTPSLILASAGLITVIAMIPQLEGAQEAVRPGKIEVNWAPPTAEELGLDHAWAVAISRPDFEHDGDSATGVSVAPPVEAMPIVRDGSTIGWVVPDRDRVQAVMDWEVEQAQSIVAARESARSSVHLMKSKVHSSARTFSSVVPNKSVSDDPRLRIGNRRFSGMTYRKPAWLEAWGRTLDRLDQRRRGSIRVR